MSENRRVYLVVEDQDNEYPPFPRRERTAGST